MYSFTQNFLCLMLDISFLRQGDNRLLCPKLLVTPVGDRSLSWTSCVGGPHLWPLLELSVASIPLQRYLTFQLSKHSLALLICNTFTTFEPQTRGSYYQRSSAEACFSSAFERIFKILFCFVFDKVSLYIPDWPQAHY